MSHFTVGVILKEFTEETLRKALAPFQENNMGDCPKEYLAFNDEEDEYRTRYENESQEVFKLPNGEYGYTWTKEHIGKGYPVVEVKHKERFKTFEQFMQEYCSAERDEQTGRYGYWENPNAKWDWWEVGGRWSDCLKMKNGTKVDFGIIKDIDFSLNQKAYDEAIRFWELIVEEQPLKDGEEKPFNFYKPSYFINQYGTKEEYAKQQATFHTYALVTLDGVWHEKGQMGWFAMSNATKESTETYLDSFYKELQKPENQDCYFVVVDCHI